MISDHTTTGPGANSLVCRRCGHTLTLQTPLPLHVAIGVIKAFQDLHQWCYLYVVFQSESEENDESSGPA